MAARLAFLRGHGVQIAVDDFGTGYANLVYLTSLPLDAIKIDRAMVADLVGRERDRIVVKAMIAMARELGLKIIVEGVESVGQLDLVEPEAGSHGGEEATGRPGEHTQDDQETTVHRGFRTGDRRSERIR